MSLGGVGRGSMPKKIGTKGSIPAGVSKTVGLLMGIRLADALRLCPHFSSKKAKKASRISVPVKGLGEVDIRQTAPWGNLVN